MPTFVIIPTSPPTEANPNALNEVILEKYKNKSFRLPMGEWLVSYEGTSKQLSDEMGLTPTEKGLDIPNPELPAAVILNVSAYWGRAGKDVWEWLSVNGA